jgi:hypothetical protein
MNWSTVSFNGAAGAYDLTYDLTYGLRQQFCRCEPIENNNEITKILRGGITTLTEQGNPDKMRDYLAANELVGRRSSGSDCVMARFFNGLLREQDIDNVHTNVSGLSVVAYSKTNTDSHTSAIELPRTIGTLVSKFDRGEYPELDAEIQALLDAEQRKTQLVNA